MIFLDSDVLLIDLRYRRDPKYAQNASFMAALKRSGQGAVTSIFNVLEICGVLSFNLNEQQLVDLYHHLPTRYNLRIYPDARLTDYLPRMRIESILQIMRKKASLGDALIIRIVLEMGPRCHTTLVGTPGILLTTCR